MSELDIPVIRKWVKALRSRRYRQAEGVLACSIIDTKGNTVEANCCLGVLIRVQGAKVTKVVGDSTRQSFVPYKYSAGLSDKEMHEFACMNDHGSSFRVIANKIERDYLSGEQQ